MKWQTWLCCGAVWALGCVAIPAPAAEPETGIGPDGSTAELLELDAGPQRPPTGEGYSGPTCASGGTTAGAGGTGAGALDGDGGGSDGDALQGPGVDGWTGDEGAGESTASGPAAAAPMQAGEVVITELMIDPKALRDDDGEWIELWNPSSTQALDLSSCVLDDGSSTLRALTGLVLAQDAVVTIARGEHAGFSPDLVLAFSLTNAADTVAVICGGVEIDRVRYGTGFPLVPGASLALDPDAATAFANDAPDAWCAAVDAYALDLGTPGAANPSCDPQVDDDAGMP